MKNMKKKVLCAVLTFAMVAGLMPLPAFAAPITFTDVSSGDWFYADVQKAVDTGLINGFENNTYRPNNNMTYAEAVKLAAVMYSLATTGSIKFPKGDPWYKSYVDYAKNTGVISRNYDWNEPATRAGYMEIFAKAIPDMPANAGIQPLTAINSVPDGSIPDVSMSHSRAAAIYKLDRAGIVQGSDDQHNCKPYDYIRRSEVAAILNRMTNAGERIQFSMGNDPLHFSTQPKDATVSVGSNTTFTVAAAGGKAPYTYKWHYFSPEANTLSPCTDKAEYYEWFEGVDSTTLTVKNWSADLDQYRFVCEVTDADGEVWYSNAALLTVITAGLKITTQPKDTTVAEGDGATFTVAASGGKTPYKYEWHVVTGSNDYTINNARYFDGFNSDTLIAKNCKASDRNGDKYYCIITDADGKTVTSDKATLTVNK